jgi:type I restriction enzyme S subunit
MDTKDRTSNWITTAVGEVAALIRGITYGKEQSSKTPQPNFKPVLRANNINGTLNFEDLVFVPQNLIDSQQIIKAGDIIFAMSSGSKHLVGKSARARFDYDGSYGAFCGLLRPCKSVNKEFLYYVFQNNKFRRLISEVARGSSINNLKREHIVDFEILLPPLPEQQRIVAKIEELFSELDNGIENLKTAQAQLKVYRQALLKHAFEGKLTAKWREENKGKLETAAALLKRIQAEKEQRYRQQLAEWEAAGKQGSKPKAPKILPPLAAEELAGLPELPEGWLWGEGR